MLHDDFIRSLAAERYVLDEMSDSEMEEYETHCFTCPACAAQVIVVFEFAGTRGQYLPPKGQLPASSASTTVE